MKCLLLIWRGLSLLLKLLYDWFLLNIYIQWKYLLIVLKSISISGKFIILFMCYRVWYRYKNGFQWIKFRLRYELQLKFHIEDLKFWKDYYLIQLTKKYKIIWLKDFNFLTILKLELVLHLYWFLNSFWRNRLFVWSKLNICLQLVLLLHRKID